MGFSSLDDSMTLNVSATSAENATAEATATPSSANRRPTLPSRKMIGTNTEISTAVVASTAKPTCRAPL